jgi:hypothetical protein
VKPLVGTIGQPRALDAIELGLGMETHGFNLFVAGAPGTGRRTTALDYLRSKAATMPVPDDWVYVHDFAVPDRPRAIRLPAGSGARFAADMDGFVITARREIPRAFESDDYDRRRRETLAEASSRQEALQAELVEFAAARNFALQVGPTGIASIPLIDGKPITREEYAELDEARRETIATAGAEIEERTGAYARRLHQYAKEAAEKVQQLDREVALFATGPLFQELEARYTDQPEVLAYLDSVKRELLARLDDFRSESEQQPALPAMLGGQRPSFERFGVNVFVDNSVDGGAPVIVEGNPTHPKKLGPIQ